MAKKARTTDRPHKVRSSKWDDDKKPTFWDKLLSNPRSRGSRAEREEAINRLIQRSFLALVIIIGVIIAAAFIYEFLVAPQLALATVNGDFARNIEDARFLALMPFIATTV